MQIGDFLVFPNKHNRTLDLGQISGEYEYVPGEAQPHRRRVTWVKTGVARKLFSQKALYEVGSALTLFTVKNHAEEFFAFITASTEEQFTERSEAPPSLVNDEEDNSSIPYAARIEDHTRDFLAATLLHSLTHEEFENFTADLLECMGYRARVTQYCADGGVDVIAHKDPLGVEPPIIKVQCKHSVATQGRPAVQQLIGTLDKDEVGLFVTLGTYSAEAFAVERERQNLRLFTGTDLTELILQHYEVLPAQWRERMRLRQVYAVVED